MDALVFGIVICLGIGVIALLVKIFNKGKSLSPATTEESDASSPDIFTKPEYDNTPGNIYYNKFHNLIRSGKL